MDVERENGIVERQWEGVVQEVKNDERRRWDQIKIKK